MDYSQSHICGWGNNDCCIRNDSTRLRVRSIMFSKGKCKLVLDSSPTFPRQHYLLGLVLLSLGMLPLMSDGFLHKSLIVPAPVLTSSTGGFPRSTTSSSSLYMPSPSVSPSLIVSKGRIQPDEFYYDATLSNETFSELYSDHMPPWLLEKCIECGFLYPTLIQQRALDCFFDDEPNSMVIQAQTGSGKTLTYLLPLLSKLEYRASVQAMIVVPTRELGLQVATVAKRLASRKFMVMSLLQGSQLKRQRAWAWAETPQLVIGTPSELLDMVQYGGLPRISTIRTVVVDEVDACLVHNSASSLQGSITSSGGSGDSLALSSSLHLLLSKYLSPTYADEDDIDDEGATIALADDSKKKLKRKFRQRQTIFCSATIPQHRYFLKQCKANQWTLEEPEYVCTSPGEALPPTLDHAYMVCQSKDDKLATLRRIIQKLQSPKNKVLVFFDAKRPMEEVGIRLCRDLENGIFYQEHKVDIEANTLKEIVSVLRFEDPLTTRSGATKAFSDGGNFRIMLTTDLAARGLDLLGITHVIHFDLPLDADSYLHRSGRTGRANSKGQVISILTADQEFVLVRLSNALNIDVKCIGRQKVKKTT
jgi:superfamily II DNA/RNA helicase